MDFKDLTDEQKAEITFIKDGLRVSKVVATRAVKTKRGDFFVGMSAAWDSTQEDAGTSGADLIDAMEEGEQTEALVLKGMDMRKARIAASILGMQVDLQATGHALGGGAITHAEYEMACKFIKNNYGKLLAQAVAGRGRGE